MMLEALSEVLFPDRCFFEGGTCGFQGDPIRHVLMAEAAGLAAPADRPMRILEIGSWIGASALTWSQAIARFAPQGGSVMCVDPWVSYMGPEDVARGGVYRAMDIMGRSGLAYDLFRHNIRFGAPGVRIDHVRGLSTEALPTFQADSFDLIYVDGSHYFEDVLLDLQMAHGLLREGGIMCGDDLELQAGDCDRAFLEGCGKVDFVEDPRTGRKFHPGVTRAVDSCFGPVTALRGFWAMRKGPEGYDGVYLRGEATFIPEHFPDDLKRPCREFLEMLREAYREG